jgi:hypothetical protein
MAYDLRTPPRRGCRDDRLPPHSRAGGEQGARLARPRGPISFAPPHLLGGWLFFVSPGVSYSPVMYTDPRQSFSRYINTAYT